MPSEEAIIADRSPLIGLAKIGQLDLLPQLARRVVVPPAVWNEVVDPAMSAPGAREIARSRWMEIITPDQAAVAAYGQIANLLTCQTRAGERNSYHDKHSDKQGANSGSKGVA